MEASLSHGALACRTFILNRERAVDYLNMLERIYVFDGFAGWDPEVCLHMKTLNKSQQSCHAFCDFDCLISYVC